MVLGTFCRSRILDILKSVGFIKFADSRNLKDLNKNSSKISIIKSALLTGLYPDILRVDKLNKKFLLEFVTSFSLIFFFINNLKNFQYSRKENKYKISVSSLTWNTTVSS
jgi:hypothetical protein